MLMLGLCMPTDEKKIYMQTAMYIELKEKTWYNVATGNLAHIRYNLIRRNSR